MSIRFDHIQFDEQSQEQMLNLRAVFMQLELKIDDLMPGRSKANALTALEESYMWVGKAIRDDQKTRTQS
jgi:hypothetical protein